MGRWRGLSCTGKKADTLEKSEGEFLSRRDTVKRPSLTLTPLKAMGGGDTPGPGQPPRCSWRAGSLWLLGLPRPCRARGSGSGGSRPKRKGRLGASGLEEDAAGRSGAGCWPVPSRPTAGRGTEVRSRAGGPLGPGWGVGGLCASSRRRAGRRGAHTA